MRRPSLAFLGALAVLAVAAGFVAVASTAAGTGDNFIAVVDVGTGGDVGRANSLVLDSSGNPVVSYADRTDRQLTVLHCSDPACNGERSITLPDQIGTPSATSIALDANDLPVVAYASFGLKLLRCGDTDCSTGNAVTTLDGAASIQEAVLELDSTDRPVVAFTDAFSGVLKVLHCTDVAYSSFEVFSGPPNEQAASVSLELDATDNPVLSYTSDGVLRLLRCDDATCSSHTTAEPLPPSDDCCSIVDTSLALDSSSRPVVSYFGQRDIFPVSRSLFVLRCGDQTCSADNSVATVDEEGAGPSSSLALDGNDAPVVSYLGDGAVNVLHCGSATCTTSNSIESPADLVYGGTDLALVLDGDGNPVVSYSELGDLRLLHCGNPNCSDQNSIVVADRGTYSGIVGQSTSLQLNQSGNPVVAYYDETNEQLKIAYCGDRNCSNNNQTQVLQAGASASFVSLMLDGSANPVVSYYDNDNADLAVLRCANPECAATITLSKADTAGDVGSFASLALDAGNRPVISYLSVVPFELRVLHCGDPTCSFGNTITAPDSARFVGSQTSLALDNTGSPVVAYMDTQFNQLKLLHCSDPNCSSNNTISVVGSRRSGGWNTSLVLDASGNPVIAYAGLLEDTNVLRVLHCGDPNCTADNSLAIVGAAAGYGDAHTSLELDGAGYPVVSYFDGGALRVLHCGDADCRKHNRVAVIDPGYGGRFGSLELDAAGYPVVGYYEEPRGNLRVLHCGDAACGGAEARLSGDVNCDAQVDAVDATLILQFHVDLIHTLSCEGDGDVDRDGRVSSLDAALVLQYVAGLLDALPV